MGKAVIGVLASGRGSNLQAIIDAINGGQLKAQIGVVISDNPDAAALQRAAEHKLTNVCIARNNYSSKRAFEEAIHTALNEHKVELLVLAGFMRILSPDFIKLYSGRIINIHPSLLPAFPGLNAQKQAIDYGAKVSGCTVHFVDEGMDTGPIIVQQAVNIEEGDSPDTLSKRILQVEHQLYPHALGLFCERRLRIEGRRVQIIER